MVKYESLPSIKKDYDFALYCDCRQCSVGWRRLHAHAYGHPFIAYNKHPKIFKINFRIPNNEPIKFILIGTRYKKITCGERTLSVRPSKTLGCYSRYNSQLGNG